MTNAITDQLSQVPMSPNLVATLARAAEHANARQHREVTLEHLLLASIDDPDAGQILVSSNVDPAKLAASISGHLDRTADRVPPGDPRDLTISAELSRILAAAAAAAHQGRRPEISGAIVLAAIVGDGKSEAAQLLRVRGLTFDAAIRALQRAAEAAALAGPHATEPQVMSRQAGDATSSILASARERVETRSAPGIEETRASLVAGSGGETPSQPVMAADTASGGLPAGSPPGRSPLPPPLPPEPPDIGTFGRPEADVGRETWPLSPQAPAREAVPPAPPTLASAANPASNLGSVVPGRQHEADVPFRRDPARRRGESPRPEPAYSQEDPRFGRFDPLSAPAGIPSGDAPAMADRHPALVIEAGQFSLGLPRRMRVLTPVLVEARIAKGRVRAVVENAHGGGPASRYEVATAKALAVRLRGREGEFWIETASPETQWIENASALVADEFAIWRWIVTPRTRGRKRLQLVISARAVGAEGPAAQVALPDQVAEVRVSADYARTGKALAGWVAAALAGGLLARFGGPVYDAVLEAVGKLMAG